MANSRYIFLDGLRGIAAIAVVIFHGPSSMWGFKLGHGYLAVDLFFALSGFVVANAYDDKIANGTLRLSQFMCVRLVRLYPVYALSVLLCVLIYFFVPRYWPIGEVPMKQWTHLAAILALMFIPCPMGGIWLFGLNTPYWSLFFEVLVNLLYALGRRFLRLSVLTAAVFLFGLVLSIGTIRYHAIDFGSKYEVLSVLGGVVRASFGFSIGLLLHRYREKIQASFIVRISPWIALVTVGGLFAVPSVPGFNAAIDLFAVGLIFPLCIAICCGVGERRFVPLLNAIGSASYPLYVLHFPLITLIRSIFHDDFRGIAPLIGLAVLGFLMTVSITVEKSFDIPIRRWLSTYVSRGLNEVRTRV